MLINIEGVGKIWFIQSYDKRKKKRKDHPLFETNFIYQCETEKYNALPFLSCQRLDVLELELPNDSTGRFAQWLVCLLYGEGFKFCYWPCSFSLLLGNFRAKSNISTLVLATIKGFNAWFEVWNKTYLCFMAFDLFYLLESLVRVGTL